jgi:hypothetical protein
VDGECPRGVGDHRLTGKAPELLGDFGLEAAAGAGGDEDGGDSHGVWCGVRGGGWGGAEGPSGFCN